MLFASHMAQRLWKWIHFYFFYLFYFVYKLFLGTFNIGATFIKLITAPVSSKNVLAILFL